MVLCEVVTFGLFGCLAFKLVGYLIKLVQPGLDVKGLGNWAVVTGATDGIGKGFAEELAKKGLNIVLVSRTLEKLKKVGTEIEEKYKVKTRTMVVDFTEMDSVYDKLVDGIKDIDGEIGILVNNVGIGYDYPEFLLDMENLPTKSRDMVSCNISSIINATRAILPGMVSRKKGAIINLSSFSALNPSPLLSLYSGTKAFAVNFSRDLHVEYESKGITVMCLAPYFVVSNMSKIKKPSFLIPSPTTYCRSALGRLGVETVSTGYWPHDLVLFGSGLLNMFYPKYTFNFLLGIRKRALKKKEK